MSPIRHSGNFDKTENFLRKASELRIVEVLKNYGVKGVENLSQVTPIDSGLTSLSWDYEIETTSKGYKLIWTNDNIVDNVPVAILLQYGHATRSGTFIQGIDYINPALKPILDSLSQELWKEVTSL